MDHLHQIRGVGPPRELDARGQHDARRARRADRGVNLGLLVGGVTYRNPALLAKVTTTLDVISGGRAILGIGAALVRGGARRLRLRLPAAEGALRAPRGRAADRAAMFTRGAGDLEGTHYRVARRLNNPQPIRGDIPIMIGGSGEKKTLRMVAQYADASNFFGDVERVRHLLGVLEGHCERLGRDPARSPRRGSARSSSRRRRRRPTQLRARRRGAAACRPSGWPPDRRRSGHRRPSRSQRAAGRRARRR